MIRMTLFVLVWGGAIALLYAVLAPTVGGDGLVGRGRHRASHRAPGSRIVPLPPLPDRYVDLDTDVVPIGDHADPTSLLFELSMEYGAVLVDHSPTGEAIVHIKGQKFTGVDDLAALRNARDALNLGEARFITEMDERLQAIEAEEEE